MPITSFTVDGVEVRPINSTFEVRETVGGVSTLSCDIVSVGASPLARYGVFSDVVVVEDGVTIFAGTVTQARERGVGGPVIDSDGNPQIVTTITVEDHSRIADRDTATETVAAGTLLKAFLTTLVTNHLGTFGVSLDGSQANGPALPDISFDTSRASEVLQALSDSTGYLWRIDYDKKLRMWLAGDLAAPFNINQSDVPAKWGGDVEVETILGDTYANRVVVIGDPINVIGHTETFTGDGSTYIFPLEYTLTAMRYQVIVNGAVELLTFQGIGFDLAVHWLYYASDNTIRRTISGIIDPPDPGATISITFDGTFSATATAEDAGEIAAHGLYEHVEHRSDITSTASAQDIADALLAQLLVSGQQSITYTTRVAASTLRAGQLQTVTAPARDISGDYIISDMRVYVETNPMSADGWVTRQVTAKQQQVISGKWQNTYHDWLKVGSGGSATQVAAAGPAASGPSPPNTSVQFNNEGQFGGDIDFTYDLNSQTVMVGTGHVSRGEANLLVGASHTVR